MCRYALVTLVAVVGCNAGSGRNGGARKTKIRCADLGFDVCDKADYCLATRFFGTPDYTGPAYECTLKKGHSDGIPRESVPISLPTGVALSCADGTAPAWKAKREAWCAKPDGTRHGKLVHWNKAGKQSSEKHYVDGQRHGLSRTWHDNGKVAYEETTEHGKTVGSIRWYRDTGDKWQEALFDANGTRLWTKKFKDGRVIAKW